MGNIVDTAKRCSYLTAGTSRSDISSIDNDNAITGKTTPARECSNNGDEVYCQVGNEETHLTTGNASTGCQPSVNDEANKDREGQNETLHKSAREPWHVDHSEKIGSIYSQTADHMLHSLETPRSLTLDFSEDLSRKVSPEENCPRKPDRTDVENRCSVDTHSIKELTARVSPALFDHNISEELADGVLRSDCKNSPEASSEGPRHEKRTQLEMLNYDVQALTTCGSATTNRALAPNASMKGREKRKRTTAKASDTSLKGQTHFKRPTTKASNQMLVSEENIGTSVSLDIVCLKIEKLAASPLVEQSSGDKVLHATSRSRMTKTQRSYTYGSPLTRAKAKALRISTPESVQMKRSRSGRVIVSKLDPGSESILYGRDGSICGITNSKVQRPPGISSEPPPKRKRMSRRLSKDHIRLLTF